MSNWRSPREPDVFRFIFANEIALKGLVNDFFRSEKFLFPKYREIQELYYKNYALNLNRFAMNENNADIMFADQDKNMYIVAMLNVPEPDRLLRMMFYACKTLIDEVSSGNTCNLLIEVNFLIIANFDLYPDHADYVTRHQLLSYPTRRGCTSIFWISCMNLTSREITLDDLKASVWKI